MGACVVQTNRKQSETGIETLDAYGLDPVTDTMGLAATCRVAGYSHRLVARPENLQGTGG